jgi:hypothetical protein
MWDKLEDNSIRNTKNTYFLWDTTATQYLHNTSLKKNFWPHRIHNGHPIHDKQTHPREHNREIKITKKGTPNPWQTHCLWKNIWSHNTIQSHIDGPTYPTPLHYLIRNTAQDRTTTSIWRHSHTPSPSHHNHYAARTPHPPAAVQ